MRRGYTQHHVHIVHPFVRLTFALKQNSISFWRKSGAGYTMIEALVVIAILGILVSVGATAYNTFRQRSQVSATSASISQALRQAVLNAQTGRRDSVWGADVSTTSITLYAGSSYASRIAGSELQTTFPATVTLSGTTTYSFAKRTGRPTSGGSTTITLSSVSATVNVNSLGTVTN